MTPETKPLVQKVREYAEERYTTSYGWQVVIECYTDKEIAEELANITTEQEAYKHFTWLAKLQSERESEVMSEVW